MRKYVGALLRGVIAGSILYLVGGFTIWQALAIVGTVLVLTPEAS